MQQFLQHQVHGPLKPILGVHEHQIKEPVNLVLVVGNALPQLCFCRHVYCFVLLRFLSIYYIQRNHSILSTAHAVVFFRTTY